MWKPRSRLRQIYCPAPKHIIHLDDGFPDGTFEIRVRNPDSRIRIKVTIYFDPTSPINPQTVDITGSTSLWIYAADQPRLGAFTGDIPITDLDGSTRDAPIAIPASPGLLGYSREFVTAGDFIKAWLAVSAPATVAGDWTVQIQAQPDGQRLPDDEWEEVRAQIDVEVAQISADGPGGE
jgi:hypothetical protein